MDGRQVEELLRAYAKRRPPERLFREEVARRLRARLRPPESAAVEEPEPEQPDDESPADGPRPLG